jgi:hypothetical protein
MSKVIIHTKENGGVSLTIPTGEISIDEVLAKDCPDHAIVIDDNELPDDKEFFDAWELVDGKIVVNLDKKNAILLLQESQTLIKQSALNKLMALGLTEEEALAMGSK